MGSYSNILFEALDSAIPEKRTEIEKVEEEILRFSSQTTDSTLKDTVSRLNALEKRLRVGYHPHQ